MLNKKIIDLGAVAYGVPLITELELYFEIRRLFTKFTSIISDLNTLTPEKLMENDFEILFNAINRTEKKDVSVGLRYSVDIAFCIDTNMNETNLNRLKSFWPSEKMRLLRDTFRSKGKSINTFRGKLIEINNPTGINSRFYNLEERNDLSIFLGKWASLGKSTIPLRELGGLQDAIRSDWINIGDKVRHIIIVFSESSQSENEFTEDPRLTDMWEGNEYLTQSGKRLVLFAPDALPWTFFANNWENTLHYQTNSISDLRLEDHETEEEIMNALVASI